MAASEEDRVIEVEEDGNDEKERYYSSEDETSGSSDESTEKYSSHRTSSPSRMDALPDELLLMVLSRIDDALTLLDAVPLVCKRWHRLSREPGAWNNATVFIEGCSYFESGLGEEHENHDEILNAARILLHAPALRRVCFGWYSSAPGPFSCTYDEEIMTSALRRSQAEVREIVFPQPEIYEGSGGLGYPDDPLDSMSSEEFTLLVDFLLRNRSHVRFLKLGHMLQAGTKMLRALGQCENLEELRVMLPCSTFFKYLGELRGQRLPKLKRLKLNSWYGVDNHRAFLRDLIGCVAQSVRHVRCKECCESSEVVLAELSRCVELRSLRCGVQGAALAETLVRLRSLTLVIQRKDEDQQEVLSAAERALRASGQLQDLQELRLDGGFDYGGNWDAQHSQALAMLLTTLGTKAPNVTRLSTSGMLSRQLSLQSLLGFFNSLPRLESVHIDRFQFHCLLDLAEVEGMKRISGEVTYRKGEVESFRAALGQFKRQRPEVDCRLTQHEYPF